MPSGVGSTDRTPSSNRPPSRLGRRRGLAASACGPVRAAAAASPPAPARKPRRECASPPTKAGPAYTRCCAGARNPRRPLQPQLAPVVVAVLAAAFLHVVHVGAGL